MEDRQVELAIVDLGRASFASVHAQMLEVAEAVRKRQAPSQAWLVEHDPVYTAGRATASGERAPGQVEVERGGKVTFHGPGQLVVYPIVLLARHDARAWLRALEEFGVDVCRRLGLDATASLDGTGVFVGGKKVASIGVAIRHWVSFHGIALNVAMDLSGFRAIRPCGLSPDIMSDLSTALGRPIGLDEAKLHARAAISLLAAAAAGA